MEIECDYSGTKLCYSKEKTKNELCHYPDTEYDCMNCMENSSIDQNVCKCNDGYNGIGYIECEKEVQNNNGKYKIIIHEFIKNILC